MKVFLRTTPVPALAAALLAVLLATPSPAQTNSTSQANLVRQAQLTAYRAGMAEAKNLAAANNVAGAEQAIVKLNQTRANTASWYIQTAQRLIQTAEALNRDAKGANVPALINRALELLSQADRTATSPGTHAAAKALTGFLQERYLSNHTAALASYQSALALTPSSRGAKEAVARLQAYENKRQARPPGGGQ